MTTCQTLFDKFHDSQQNVDMTVWTVALGNVIMTTECYLINCSNNELAELTTVTMTTNTDKCQNDNL